MTVRMRMALEYLEECEIAGFPWATVPQNRELLRTLRALIRRGWVVAGDGLDGTRYKLLRAGKQALRVYGPDVQRDDGICPTCCERPRHVRKNGVTSGYCQPCMKAYMAKYQEHRKRISKG